MLCVVQIYRDVLSPCVFCCLTLPGRSYLICVILFILSQTFFPMRFLFFNLTKTFLLHMLYVVQTYQMCFLLFNLTEKLLHQTLTVVQPHQDHLIPYSLCCLMLPRFSYLIRFLLSNLTKTCLPHTLSAVQFSHTSSHENKLLFQLHYHHWKTKLFHNYDSKKLKLKHSFHILDTN